MSVWTSMKVRQSSRDSLEQFRSEMASFSGRKSRDGLPPESWWQNAALSDLIEWLALLGQQWILDKELESKRRKKRRAAAKAGTTTPPVVQ